MVGKKKSDIVFEHLKKSILLGKISLGSRLPSEATLCKEFSFSRVTIREALKKLTALGLVETKHGGGTYVNKPIEHLDPSFQLYKLSEIDRMYMFEFRKMIEVESAALAAARATSQDIDEMRNTINKMKSDTQIEDVTKDDLDFHHSLAKASKNPLIEKVFSVLMDNYTAMLRENVVMMGTAGAKEHERIIGAIEIRDTNKAREFMTDHINASILRTKMVKNRGEEADELTGMQKK